MRRRTFLKAGLATALGGWLGLGSSQPRPFTVGTSVSRSGPYADYAPAIERALRMWAEEVEDAVGFGGRGARLIVRDDASDPARARRIFEEVSSDVHAFIAPYGSRLTEAVMPVARSAGTPLLAPSAGNRALWKTPSTWSAQILNPTDTMLWSSLELAAGRRWGSVALVHRDDPFSESVVAGALGRAAEIGLDVQLHRRYRSSSEAHAALAAVDAGLLIAMGFQPGGPGFGFLEDARMVAEIAAGSPPRAERIHLGIAPADPGFADAIAGNAHGVLGTTGWRPYLPTPGNEAFGRRFHERWGTEPDTHAAQAYAAGELLVRAFRRQGSIAPGGLRDALFRIDAETVFGRFAVAPSGLQTGKENAVVQWQEGRPEVVYPPRYRTAPLQG